MEQRKTFRMPHWRLFLKYALHFLIVIAKTLETMKFEDSQNLCIWLDDPLTSEKT